ncbi:transcription factor 20 [Ictalurus punctatus]|uniref:Transcription factor 20 n=1 Tax=Ictalurus punctatus TaxID=7998 RepID=A0A2D0PSV5_ICTPU|nr:transcription factor 20 [Ictalurus punctatus]XP_047006335.1 transcription factor 20 [Ictalurus punctatus]
MDPLSRLNVTRLQDPLPTPLDLTKQISEALDLVRKKRSRSDHASGTDGIRSPRSEFGYESTCVPLNASLPNGLAHQPAKTLMIATGNVQTDDVTVKETEWQHRTGGGKNERKGAPPSRLRSWLPTVEILSSECSGSVHVESISSDDSGVIENSSPNLIEWDVIQDSDSVESRNIPSTSEAENTDFFKPTQNGSTSSSSSSQERAPATKENQRNQQRASSSAGKKATASAAKRRRKKKKRSGLSSSSSAFPSHEPEIKLKYASCKEGKRESRGKSFAPYVRMEFSACTVVNFEEDGDFQARKPRQPVTSPGIVPTTSCFQLGRLGSEGKRQTGEMCCLCGRMANATGLGDLHGPYHLHGPDRKTSADLLINRHEDASAKKNRTSVEVGERWVHEDCSIWSAGVFLVKGRLYGLEEAVRIAQQAVCSCCHRCGATLGCFFKGCPNKYHFPCALQAECVFNEENFTLRCPKHKSKSGLGVSRLQNR